MTIKLMSPSEILLELARQAQQKRLAYNLSQKSLSDQTGVSLGTLKKFERSGKISLESLLKIALVLNSLEEFLELFKPTTPQNFINLDELISEKKRKRGRL